MLKINKKNEEIVIIGDSDALKDEIDTLMLALCGEAAKKSKEAGLDFYNHYVETVAGIGAYLKFNHHIDTGKFLKEKMEETEKKVDTKISKDLDDAIEQFFASLDDIIAKKKGDK
jgi:urease gamma subunit